jgi:hypothetical protein
MGSNRTVATATASNDVDEIRRRMAQIRRDLHIDMQGVVAGAEAATDWRYYVRLYPWAALGVACAAGYLVVPKRRRSVTKVAAKAAEEAVARVQDQVKRPLINVPRIETTATAEKRKSGIVGALLGMAVPVAVRAAQSYAAHFVENWIAQQGMMGVAPGQGPSPSPGPDPGPGRPDARRPH